MATNNIPTELQGVFIYRLNADGSISADFENTPVTISTDSVPGAPDMVYTTSTGEVVIDTTREAAAQFQIENGFISQNADGSWILVSNDPIGDPSKVSFVKRVNATTGKDEIAVYNNVESGEDANNALIFEYVDGGAGSGDGIYNSDTHVEMPCFLAGTMILTNGGYKAVELLNLEDEIGVIHNGMVKWSRIKALAVGKRQTNNSPFPDVAGYPVRIKESAFSPGVPFKDMLVTNDHAILINNKLVLARMLVDDENIYFDCDIKEYSFYHIDLFDHVIIDADGVQAESFNSKNHRSVYGSLVIKENKSFTTDRSSSEMELCSNPAEIYQVRKELGLKDKKIQFHQDADGLLFHLSDAAKGEIEKTAVDQNLYSFTIPPHVDTINLVSETHRLCDMIGPHVDDRRKLGLLVGDVVLFEKDECEKHEDHLKKELLEGWSVLENSGCRWTTGNAILKFKRKHPESSAVLTIKIINDVKSIRL